MFRKSATVVATAATVLLSRGGAYALLDGQWLRLGHRDTGALRLFNDMVAADDRVEAPPRGCRSGSHRS